MSTNILIVRSILVSSAAWRAKVIAAYPSDLRNASAKNLLEQLVAQAVSEEVLAALDGFTETEISRETMAAAKNVGFKLFPGTLASFISEVVERIKAARAEWRSAFQKEGGQ